MKHRRIGKRTLCVWALILVGGLVGCAKKPPADLVLIQGKIITMEASAPPRRPWLSGATASSPRQNQGNQALHRRLHPVIDLAGRTAIPGFIDSHAHFTEWERRG